MAAKILFAIPFINTNNQNSLLICLYDDIKIKGNNHKALLLYYFVEVDVVRNYNNYDSLYDFIYQNIDAVKVHKAESFATIDVLTTDPNTIVDGINQFLDAYFSSIPANYRITFKLSNTNTEYSFITFETIFDPFKDNKILFNIHKFKSEPRIDTVKPLLKGRLPSLDFEIPYYNNTAQNISIQSNTLTNFNKSTNIIQNPFSNQVNNNQTDNYNNNSIDINTFIKILNEFKNNLLVDIKNTITNTINETLLTNINNLINNISNYHISQYQNNINLNITNNTYKNELIKQIINLPIIDEKEYIIISQILSEISNKPNTTNSEHIKAYKEIEKIAVTEKEKKSIFSDDELNNLSELKDII